MIIFNRKFPRHYEKVESLEAGIVLSGDEVRSIKEGRIKLDDAYVRIIGLEVYLINAEISSYLKSSINPSDPRRMRKLLLHKKEILRLKTKMKGEGLTIVPVSCYNRGNLIKLEIALARGRKDIEKRKREKEREKKRDEERRLKEYLKK